MIESSSIVLIKNATLYSPQIVGLVHLLIAGGKIIYVGDKCPSLGAELAVQIVDAQGEAVIPGFIDAHTHITGGGAKRDFQPGCRRSI